MNDTGSVTVWLLGMCVVLLFLGGLSVDLWRVMNVRRELVGLADAAAISGATAVDEAALRAGGPPTLDVARARLAVDHRLRGRLPPGTSARADVSALRVRVELARQVPLSLLAVLLPDQPLRVVAAAEVEPRRRP